MKDPEFRLHVAPLLAVCTSGFLAACSANAGVVSGVYSNPEGSTSVEFGSGAKAHFSLHGVGGQCTYVQEDRLVVLSCDGELTTFTIENDGALKGPSDSFLTRLQKRARATS